MSLNDFVNDLASSIHSENVEKGWWDKWLDDKWSRHETAMMLTVSELSEAMEGVRKGLMDTHLPQHPMLHVELADALIRLLDLAGAYEINLNLFDDHLHQQAEEMRKWEPAEQLLRVVRLMLMPGCLGGDRNDLKAQEIRIGVVQVIAMAWAHDVNIFPILSEKVYYNRHRADHKREVREQQGGKKF